MVGAKQSTFGKTRARVDARDVNSASIFVRRVPDKDRVGDVEKGILDAASGHAESAAVARSVVFEAGVGDADALFMARQGKVEVRHAPV